MQPTKVRRPDRRRLRVGFVVAEYPGDGTSGGIGTAVRQIALALAGLGHECTVLLCGSFPMFGDGDGPIRLARVTPPQPWSALPAPLGRGASLWMGRTLASWCAQLELDVLEAPDCGGLTAFFAAFKPAATLHVVRLHTSIAVLREADNLPASRLSNWLERKAIASADLVTANSGATIERTRHALGVALQDVPVIPNPVAPGFFELADANDGAPLVVFHGRLQWAKGADIVARAVPAVLRRVPAARFRFVGEDSPTAPGGGSMRVYLEGLLPQEARPAVEFSGYVEPEQVCARLADAAVCVFPSRWDGFGIACAEAMAAAKPVIVSEQLREVVAHGATGWSVTPDSPEALANAICNLLADAELRDRLGRAARKHAREHFHPVAVAAETLTTYTGALFAEPEKAHEVSV